MRRSPAYALLLVRPVRPLLCAALSGAMGGGATSLDMRRRFGWRGSECLCSLAASVCCFFCFFCFRSSSLRLACSATMSVNSLACRNMSAFSFCGLSCHAGRLNSARRFGAAALAVGGSAMAPAVSPPSACAPGDAVVALREPTPRAGGAASNAQSRDSFLVLVVHGRERRWMGPCACHPILLWPSSGHDTCGIVNLTPHCTHNVHQWRKPSTRSRW